MKNTYNRFRGNGKSFPTLLASLLIVSSLFFTSGFASRVSADEIISPVEQTLTQEEVTPADVVVAPEETLVVSEEPVTSIIEEAAPAVEEVVAPSEEPALAPAEELAPAPASVVVTVPATLSTDKEDYHPGQTATIFGKFFAPLQSFVLKIFGSDDNNENYTESTQTVTADETGAFTATYTLDSLFRPFYEMVATDFSGTQLASSWFRDAAIDIYNQCANDDGDGYPGAPGTCNWINGAINGNNSTYQEGDSTVQRLSIKGFEPGSSHSVTFTYGTTKQGKHAYDYLTTWNYSENWIALTDLCSGIVNCTGAGVVQSVFPIPQDPNANNLDSFVRNMTMRGGTITAVSVPSVVSGSYAGDSETAITVTFTVDSVDDANDMCSTQGPTTSCAIGIWFGAHVAKTTDWQAFNGTGAGSITGSPYHVALSAFDGDSVGNRDNQMQASAIPSTIIIHKDTSPDSPQDFNFTTSGTGLSSFTLDDDNDATLSNTKIFTGLKAGTFSVTEAAFPGYGVSISCIDPTGNTTFNNTNRVANISLGDAETVECTFTNTLQSASLTLVKNVTNDNGGNALATAWTLSATGPTNISGTTGSGAVTNASVNAGVYTLSESTGPSGYTAGNWSCTAGTLNGAQLTLSPGQNATCTIINDDQPATLIVKKIVNNGNTGATKTASDFSFSVNAGTAVAFESDGQNDNTVNAGTYTVTEPAVAGYTTTYDNCLNLVIPNGGTATCTITNTAIAPTLTLVKTVLNDNGGTATASNFQGKIDGNNVAWSTAIPVSSGAHTASEVTLPTYTASVWGGDCAADGSVTLSLGQNKTCTITNDDIAPKLHLRKVVVNNNGGTKTTADFTLTANGTGANDLSGVSPVDSTGTLKADTFALSENTVAGYTASAWSCVGGTQSGSNITLGLNEEATCTITNDDQPASIKIVKNTVGGDGTFSYIVTGPLPGSPNISTTNGTGTTGFVEVSAGNYTITEGAVAGWDMTGATCDVGTPASISLANGQSVTCTFTNTKRGHLIVQKTTLPAGDTTSFSITASGNGTITGGGAGSITDATDKDYEVTPGTYSVSETVPTGWDKTGDTCQSVVVGAGETKTCTITNTKRGTIVIVKNAINNSAQDFTFNNNFANGNPTTFALDDDSNATLPNTRSFEVLPGTYAVSEDAVTGWQQESATCSDEIPVGAIAVAPGETVTCTFVNEELAKIVLVKNTVGGNGTFDFTMTGAGLPTTAQLVTTANTATQTFSDLDQDNTYSIAETVPEGWDLTSSSCTGTGNTPASITPNPGETVTCTFTNTKKPKLTVTKVVINDNGGTKEVVDFPLFVDQTSVVSGATNIFTIGAHTVTETNQTGYAGVISGDCAANGSVTLAAGDDKHCTITNNDNAPSLTLVKQVVNDNGGTALPTAWTLTATGPTSVSGAGGATSGATFGAGTYSLSESAGPAGYAAGQWSCTGTGTQNGTEITLGLGQSATCTIVNNDVAPKLTVIKHVINDNGGAAVAGDFTMNVTATSPSDASFAGDENGTAITLDAGAYSVDESAFVGYAKTLGANCSGTIAVGEEKTCTVTNDDIAPKLTVIKHVINDNGGAAEADDFTMNITGTNVSDPSFVGAEVPGVTVTLNAGNYVVSEDSSVNGYVGSFSNECTGAIAVGEEKTCTITNNDKAPKLTLNKIVVNDNGGTSPESAWTLSATGPTTITGPGALGATDVVSGGTFTAGEYVLSESVGPTGYTASTWSCSNNDNDGTISLGLGDEVTCTITNDDQPGHVIVNKVTNPTDTTTQFPISISGTYPVAGASQNIVGGATVDYVVDAGTYAVTETVPAGWDQTGNTCAGLVVANGQTKECTITNTQRGHLIVDKVTDPAGDATSFAITASGDGAITGNVVASVTDATNKDYEVTPGTYSVSETVPAGWVQTTNTCTGVTVAAGETKTCVITNTKLGSLKIVKDSDPDDEQNIQFTTVGTGLQNFTLDDDAGIDSTYQNNTIFNNLTSGSYTVNEVIPNVYWTLQSISCVDVDTAQPYTNITTTATGVTVNLTAGKNVSCTFLNHKQSPTRTQGFWQTHTSATNYVFGLPTMQRFVGLNIWPTASSHKGIITATSTPGASQLFGAFYSSISQKSTGKGKTAQRTEIDKARMQLLQQLVAAKLNCAAFGCTTSVQTSINAADAAYAGNDINAIKSYIGIMDAYNNSGDTLAIPSLAQSKATPKTSQQMANLLFWDQP